MQEDQQMGQTPFSRASGASFSQNRQAMLASRRSPVMEDRRILLTDYLDIMVEVVLHKHLRQIQAATHNQPQRIV